MPTEVIMPKVDMDMAEGKIAAWHVGEGERIEKSAPLFDIETDKAAMEVESPATGYLHHATPEGAQVAIGHAVAWIYAEGEPITAPPGGETNAPSATPAEAAATAEPADTAGTAAPAAGPEPEARSASTEDTAAQAGGTGVRATPAARRLAKNLGVDIAALDGTGPRGRIQKRDVEAAQSETRVEERPPETTVPQQRDSASNRPAPLPARRADADAQPLVFLHGFAADAAGWAPLERQLGKRPDTVRIELPGHGRAEAAAIGGFADLLADVRARFDALSPSGVHLVGHSLGGALAIALAADRPHAVGRLTLIAPAGLGPEFDGTTIAGITRASRAESLAPWLKKLVADPERISWNYVQATALQRSDPKLREAQAAMADALFPDGVQAFEVKHLLKSLDCKTRIIWGRKDAIIPWRHALEAPGRISLNLFEDLGHMPHIEAPDLIASVMTE